MDLCTFAPLNWCQCSIVCYSEQVFKGKFKDIQVVNQISRWLNTPHSSNIFTKKVVVYLQHLLK